MNSLAFTMCASWLGALPPITFLLLLISRNRKPNLFLYIRIASICLCSLGNAIGCSLVYTSVRTTLPPPELIFLAYIFQGLFDFEIYWIFECGTSLGGALQVFAGRSWKWKTHVFPCALFLFGALAGLAVVILRYFFGYCPSPSYMEEHSDNSSGPASHLSLGVIAICSRPVVVSGSYISGVAGGRSMVCAERLNLMHMVLVVVQLIVAVLMACNIKTALFDQVY